MARTANAKLDAVSETLSSELPSPLYNQLFLIFRNKILSGEYPDGSYLPSEMELAAAYDVSRVTAKRALNELAQAGYAVRQRGRGTRVRNKGGATVVSGSVQSLMDSLRANTQGRAQLLDFGYIVAPPDVSAVLRLPAGSIVQRAVRVWSTDGMPYSHLTTFVPSSIGQRWTARDFEQSGLASLLERSGVSVQFAEQVITATMADNSLAESLKVVIGSPLLRAVRTYFDEDEVPVEYLIAHYPPDRYQLIVTLTKEADEGLPERSSRETGSRPKKRAR